MISFIFKNALQYPPKKERDIIVFVRRLMVFCPKLLICAYAFIVFDFFFSY